MYFRDVKKHFTPTQNFRSRSTLIQKFWNAAHQPGQQNFVRWCLIFVDPRYRTHNVLIFWRLEFLGGFGKFVRPCLKYLDPLGTYFMEDNLLENNTFWLRDIVYSYSQQLGFHENSWTHSIALGRHYHRIQMSGSPFHPQHQKWATAFRFGPLD
jgi:hypothetical protein